MRATTRSVLGGPDPLKINIDAIEDRFARTPALAASLREVKFASATALLATYAGRAADLQPWLVGAQINRDRNLRLQYLAGMTASLYQETAIFDGIIAHRKYPSDLFEGSEKATEALKRLLSP